jgi:hypothetical protein
MTKSIQEIIKLIIVVCITAGAFLLAKNYYFKNSDKISKSQSKASLLKKYLIKNEKPQRVEIVNYSQRFEKDVAEIKKLKVPLDSHSKFYVTVQFFTDESDPQAPLIAQVRFIDLSSGNQIKEESINLE